MLRSLLQLDGFAVQATDGAVGTVRDCYFDDERWGVRYLVVETGHFWQEPCQVLISPVAFAPTAWQHQTFHLTLTRERVKACPGVEGDLPVSRQAELEHFRYYGWPVYWGNDGLWGNWGYPARLAEDVQKEWERELGNSDPHLRSLREVVGYHLEGSDGELGHIMDLIVDDQDWAIRYLVIDTSNWWSGKHILVPPHWVDRISWPEHRVKVDLPREAIQNGPVWHPEVPISRAFEVRLYDYYRRPAYWHDDGEVNEASRTREYLGR
jgi:hypothetical protein